VRALTCVFGTNGLATMEKLAQVLLILQVHVKTMSVFHLQNKMEMGKDVDNKMAQNDVNFLKVVKFCENRLKRKRAKKNQLRLTGFLTCNAH
jgi:hypothetical protein